MYNYRPKWERRVIRHLSRCAFLLLLALAQTALLPSLWLFRVNLVVVVVICWTLVRGLEAGLGWALYGGLALGFLSPAPLGAHLLGLVLVALLTAVATEQFPRDNLLLLVLCIVAGTLLNGVVMALILRLTQVQIAWLRYPFTVVLPETVANVAWAVPVMWALRRLHTEERSEAWR